MGWVIRGFALWKSATKVLTHGPKVVSSPLWNQTLKGKIATLSLRQILSPLRIPHS